MRVLIMAAQGVEDMEFYYPYYRFQEAGMEVDVAGLSPGSVTGKHGYTVKVTVSADRVTPDDYGLLFLPGGKAPEILRLQPEVISLVKHFSSAGKIICAICHGAQILISADALAGKKATCVKSIRDDIIAAGADYADQPVVVDGRLITSRVPDDLPQLMRETFKAAQSS